MSENLSYLSGRKGLHENLFEISYQLVQANGTPDTQQMQQIAKEYLIGDANIYSTYSFYDLLRPENKNKKAYVCNGSSCLCAGTQSMLKTELKKYLKEEEIGEMTCLGRCHENSAFHYNGHNYSGRDVDDIASVIKSKTVPQEVYATKASGTSVLMQTALTAESFATYLQHLFTLRPGQVLNEIKKAHLRGRGGAGFPMGFKLESTKKAKGKHKFIVCNADEGDPGAYSDRYLLEEQPLRVLLGMLIAGYVSCADTGVIYIRAEYPESQMIIKQSIRELGDQNLLGDNILNSGFSFGLKLIKAQGAYICGEETALLSSIEGQRPEVRIRPPFPSQQGLFNMPAIVNSVETLANVPFILKHGGDAFKRIGTSHSKGTKLVSLDSSFNKPGIYEIEMGTSLKTVIEQSGSGFRKDVKALHIGGPLGGLVPVSNIDSLHISFESFAENGFLLGHASIVGIPESFPMIEYIKHLFQFTAHESCGKCFPCRLGSTRGSELLQKATESDYKIDRQLFSDLLDTMQQGSLCALGSGLPLPVQNVLQYFDRELEDYFE
ncbi:NADH-ubiquinone oxidoreductase-F iron-sulfur binding region domain-containing protein [Methanolobus halotolerans]|uniref:Formate dehydrogenase n=1 Tax=Methanolobus halotolerans TaxID=2052935 RepID=A0A4E0Q6W8_9EURY|nr:NADH-ubiquinone oxidoreductase-F iron-sulfur binding region domain-containing protein [Methanolobus halotolerans]TGC10637.1 formate dehydrogenase [Methanolobus halotolerans]